MKRKISIVLAIIMILVAIPISTFAQEYDKQLEEAILKSKKMFEIGSEYDKFNHSVSQNGEQIVFYLSWNDSSGKLGSIDVTITEDGTVLGYGKWKASYSESKPKLATVTKEEGLEKAKKFIKMVFPESEGNIKYIDSEELLNVNANSYYYNFVRTYNGIPYANNTIDVTVDNVTGEVMNYYANWDLDIEFQDKDNIISLEEAEELYKEKIGLKLMYKSTYVKDVERTFLTYSPLNINLAINAKDGEIVSFYDYYGYGGYAEDTAKSMGEAGYNNLIPDEQKAVEGIQGIISKEKAEKIARDILEIDSEYKLEYIYIGNDWRDADKYIWQVSFSKQTDNDYYYASATIDAKTEDIMNFYISVPTISGSQIKFDREESLDIAKDFIKKMEPEKSNLVELTENIVENRLYVGQTNNYFTFIRKVDNAYVQDEGIYVLVDATSGKITDYRVEWYDREFPTQDNVMDIEKAHEILFKDVGLELKYVTNESIMNENENNKKEAILVYGLKNDKPATIDANNGGILNYNGEPYKESVAISYNDIENSYAKDKINILAQYGIALPGEEFKPQEKIIQKDFLYLLAKASNPYYTIDNEDNLYAYLINMEIIKEDERDPDKVITKEEGVKYIIRAMNYDEIADLTEIFKDLFKDTEDIDPNLKGYIAIAYGLNIVQGNNGYLNPKVELNRENAANMIYNYLFGN